MDRYTKAVLTVIAVCLVVIALKLSYPPNVQTVTPPTYGDFLSLTKIKGTPGSDYAQKRKDLLDRLPIVRIQGGNVDAKVRGSVDAEVSGTVGIE